MQQYLKLLQHILDNGTPESDRTGVGTLSTFGYQFRHCIPTEGFPLLTTKKLHFKSILHELLWFIRGDKDTKYLEDNKISIWKEWQDEEGNVGEMYGFLMRTWPGRDGKVIDQIQTLIDRLKSNPSCRRHLVTQWNPDSLDKQALACCHILEQFKSYEATHEQRAAWFKYLYPESYELSNFDNLLRMKQNDILRDFSIPERTLSLQMYQRSADTFLGVSYNIASYATLLMIIADVTNMIPWEFIHTFGDVHIYKNHIEQTNLQLTREPRKLPKLFINAKHDNINDYKFEDFELVGYDPHPHIKADVAV